MFTWLRPFVVAARRDVQPRIATQDGHVLIQTGGVDVNVTDSISGAAASEVCAP